MQYADKYEPTADAAGDLSKSSKESGFAKLSDAAINAIPADASGYYYYKLEDADDTDQPVIFARTKHSFSDTARGFGWLGEYDLCDKADVTKCDWKSALVSGVTIRGIRFETKGLLAQDCRRWFADHSYRHLRPETCYEFNEGEPRRFAKGKPCAGQVRDHVTIYKLFPKDAKTSGDGTDSSSYFRV